MAARACLLRFAAVQAEQWEFFHLFLLRHMSTADLQRRTVWIRDQSYLPQAVTSWSNMKWKQNCVSRANFRFLCRKLRPFVERHSAVWTPLSVKQRVALCLTTLGSNSELQIICNLFGFGVSTTCVALHEVCHAIVANLAVKHINFPTGESLRKIINGFLSKWVYPQYTGVINGSHISIIVPTKNPVNYYNRKGHHSLILQAVVDHEYKFLDVCVGWPGSVHDARVLGNSKIYSKCESGSSLPN